jgi:hypothetical protein
VRFLIALVGVPLVVWAASLGSGLAVERALRLRLSNALLLPLGFCAAMVVTFPGYVAGAGDGLAIALLVAITLAGLLLARDDLRARINPGWAGAAGLAAYVLYMLPVIAYGHWTWAGYDFVNDSGFEMVLAEHVKGFGTTVGSIPESSARQFIAAYLSNSYPLGTQALLGTFSGLIGTSVAVMYQAFISVMAAVGAISLACLAGAFLKPRRAAIAGLAAMGANLTYQYALQGGIKEIGLLATLCATAAFAREAVVLSRPSIGRRYAAAALVAVGAAAMLATYNAVAVPYLGAGALFLIVGQVVTARVRPSPRHLGPLLACLVFTALLAIPALTTLRSFFHVAQTGQGATGVGASQYGQLLRPLPLSQISGVWLAGEYRVPVQIDPGSTLTVIATVAIFLCALGGVLLATLRRELAPLLLVGTIGLVLLVVMPRVSPYAQGKLLAIGGPAVVFAAFVFLLAVRGRIAPGALLVALALAAAIGASDLLAYSRARVAPTARMEAIEQVGRRLKGQGPVLFNEFEEYAKYFGRDARISVPFEAITPEQVKLRHPQYFYGRWFDLDAETLGFVEGYPLIVLRRSPGASRPPANYALEYENAYYEVWRRRPAPQVLGHLPEQQTYSPAGRVDCRALGRLAGHAPPDTHLVVARPPQMSWYEPLYASNRSYGWGLDPAQRGAVLTVLAGHASGVLEAPAAGRYALWVQGDFPRKVHVQVDGREVGVVSGSDTPGQWSRAAILNLAAGRHTATVTKIGGHRRHLGPGEWAVGLIGAIAIVRPGDETLQAVPVARWPTLCGTRADWVELVRA